MCDNDGQASCSTLALKADRTDKRLDSACAYSFCTSCIPEKVVQNAKHLALNKLGARKLDRPVDRSIERRGCLGIRLDQIGNNLKCELGLLQIFLVNYWSDFSLDVASNCSKLVWVPACEGFEALKRVQVQLARSLLEHVEELLQELVQVLQGNCGCDLAMILSLLCVLII